MKRLLHILLVLCISSCFNPSNRVISEDELVDILTKLHISDALQKDPANRELFENPDSVDIHSQIWEEYGYTKAEFDSTIKWYSKHPDELNDIYQKVLANLTDLEAPINQKTPTMDSIVYNDTARYLVNGMNIPDPLHFKIPNLGVGEYTLIVKAKVFNDDKTYRPGALLYAENQSQEGVYEERDNYEGYVKDEKMRTYTIRETVRDSLDRYANVLYLPRFETSSSSHLEISEIEIRYRP